jgi:hypothetical protein
MTFTDLLDRFGVPFRAEGHEHCRPGWVQTDCPLCSPGWHHYRLGFNLRRRYFSCWSCGGVKFQEALRLLLNRPYKEVRELAEGLTAGRLPDLAPDVRGKYVEPPGVGPLLPAHVAYVRSRGFSEADMSLWGVRGFGPAGKSPRRLAWRLFIPFVWRGEVVSYTTRSIADKPGLRYLSASPAEEKYDHKSLLGGEDLVPGHAVCAVEGPFDAFRIGPGTVWLSGTGYRRAQMLRLAKYPVRVVCFDNSPDAQAQARKLVRELEGYEGITYNVVLDSKDPGEATPREVAHIRNLLS